VRDDTLPDKLRTQLLDDMQHVWCTEKYSSSSVYPNLFIAIFNVSFMIRNGQKFELKGKNEIFITQTKD